MRSYSILALEGIFSWNICMVELGHMSLSLKFGENWTSGYWGLPFFIFEVFFHWRSSYLKCFFSLLWSHEFKSKIEEYWTSGCCDFPFLIFEVFFHHMYYWRSSLISDTSVLLGHRSLSLNLGKIGPVVAEIFHF